MAARKRSTLLLLLTLVGASAASASLTRVDGSPLAGLQRSPAESFQRSETGFHWVHDVRTWQPRGRFTVFASAESLPKTRVWASDVLAHNSHPPTRPVSPEGTRGFSLRLRKLASEMLYVWEGQSLAAEAAYGQEGTDASLRWRKTYVPGPSGLDDAVQVIVEQGGEARTYTYLRDELGTVIGIVAEDEPGTPAKPSVPARYRFTPYGETHAESGPELLRVKHDEDKAAAKEGTAAGAVVTQTVADERVAAAGALVLDWSLPLDAATFASGMVVEKRGASGWAPLAPEEFVIGPEPEDGGVSAGGGGPPQLLVLTRNGWTRGTSYRVRLTAQLADQVGRAFAEAQTLEWQIPAAPAAQGAIPAVNFEQKIPTRFESWRAASDTLGGRFPGGQTSLFQGAWTDPVTGLAYHRARWYDARTASWLSEDPLLDVDSTNLYAFVGHSPAMGIDPTGQLCIGKLKDTSVCRAITGFIERNVLGVDEQAAQDAGDAQFLIAKFGRAQGRAPGTDEVVFSDSENKRYLTGDGRWKATTGEIYPDHAEYIAAPIVGGAAAAARVAAGGLLKKAAVAAVSVLDDLAGEVIGVNPSVVKNVTRLALPAPRTANQWRNTPGSAFGRELPAVEDGRRWLRGTGRDAGRVPGQIAGRLQGRSFSSFDEFREQFWREVASDEVLSKQFGPNSLREMKAGRAPFSPDSGRVGGRIKYEIDHMTEIQNGGGVYDMNNLVIRTPLNHIGKVP